MTDRGIPPSDLNDEDLLRELRHLYETREQTLVDGSVQSLETHTDRMLAIEAEYATRFATEPDPNRTREGARARAGQPPTDDRARV